jgi:hypothetical protein
MRIFLAAVLAIGLSVSAGAQSAYFFPGEENFDPSIPTPEQFLGYPIGQRHTRHDRLVEYFRTLDMRSDRLSLEIIGHTFEHREQAAAVITSPGNQGRIESIRKAHLAGQSNGGGGDIPLVIHLGYNVHGNEPSSSEAAMLTAYYLTASRSPETLAWLEGMVITMDPVINPDGRDRHTHWANMHRAEPPVADPLDREHNEVWPGGRFNHYWFDLNRDWFPAVFPETRNRIRFFHKWRPYVQTDHHEMGTQSTFYFDPGEDASNNPIVPDYLYGTLYPLFSKYFVAGADKLGSMYFTREQYDKLYPGYGSSYINFYGGAGFLFEQASSRGHVQETSTVPLTFAFTIRNQVMGSLMTVRASFQEKASLREMRRRFHEQVSAQRKASAVRGYVYGDAADLSRTTAFTEMLRLHEIDVRPLEESLVADGRRFEAGRAFFVPIDQENLLMVRSVFEKDIPYRDSSFYDASTWSLVHAYGMPHAALKVVPTKLGSPSSALSVTVPPPARSSYAYVFPATDYQVHRAIYMLQQGGAIVQAAFRPFQARVDGGAKAFGYGSAVLPVSLQRISPDSLHALVVKASKATGIAIHGLSTGRSTDGIDMGSGYVRTLRKPEVAMVIGTGLAATEAGEAWHLLDQRLHMPVSKLDVTSLPRADLARYNTIILPGGMHTALDKAFTERLRAWVQNGGTLVTLKSASEWAIRNGFTKERLQPSDSLRSQSARQPYDQAVNIEGAKAMGGSIFRADLDTTHPIGFGYTSRTISVYRNGLTFLQPSANPYSTVAQYTSDPLVGGYVHPSLLKKVRNSAAVLVGQEGVGRVVLFSDDPNFRGTWYGTNRLFLNALFFGSLMGVPAVAGEE